MQDNLPIVLAVVAVVVAVIVYFAFIKKKEELPSAKPKAIEDKKAEPAEAKKKDKSAPKIKIETPAEPLTSQDMLPETSESKQQLEAPISEPAAPAAKRDVSGLRKGLAATRGGFMARLKAIFVGKKEIDPAILEQVEEVMISSDVGVKTTQTILERLRDGMNKKELADSDTVWNALRSEATRILSLPAPSSPKGKKPVVILMVGVNGVGKTTTIGKLATKWNADDKKVMLAAGDTFRAAAVAQLEVWGKRVGADVVKGKEGADPGAVAFDATKKAVEGNADFLLVDTAGRLHTKVNLMDEIKKVKRSINKAFEGAPHETLLVVDATTGQNALTQAQMFKDALELTGIILTKLDGTAKGGVVLGVCDELKIPVRYIGLGERAEDLREFVAADFVEALFGKDDGEAEAA